ncbi:hypothetical protein [Propionibacterium sp.]|uniref:hypothetical protein n=1 Tax=Propionibacterium sp. TaxID=1977903 RepID=UPI0039E837BA
MTSVVDTITKPIRGFVPTVTKQCWGFMIGSAFFALGSAPAFSTWLGSGGANLLFFVGAIFFTVAGFIQLFLSGAMTVDVDFAPGRMVRAEWLTAAAQSFGTIMFNMSTTAALHARTLRAEEKLVWNPDASGSVAFLISGFFAFVAHAHVAKAVDPTKVAWWSLVLNFVGCVAFAFSAVGAYIKPNGDVYDNTLANWGTFIGALCFLFASLIVLPWWSRNKSGQDIQSGTQNKAK